MIRKLITIDGPAGAGKTTISRILADKLGYVYVDTGALYRGIAFEIDQNQIAESDDASILRLFGQLDIKFGMQNNEQCLISNHVDITKKIRSPQISMKASRISANPIVRDYLLSIQRKMGAQKAAVFEGRDMGTVVFPDADFKFFLIASPKERARRRFSELSGKNSQTLEQVEAEIIARDQNDMTRKIAPLKKARDAIEIDSTGISINEVVIRMLEIIKTNGY